MKDVVYVENHYFVTAKNESFKLVNTIDKEEIFILADDVGCFIFDNRKSYFSNMFVQICIEKNINVLFCDQKHSPTAELLCSFGNQQRLKRIKQQLALDQKTKNRLWRKIVMVKIVNQAKCLELVAENPQQAKFLQLISKQVDEGDHTNREAYAARRYFIELFGANFKRGRFDDAVNASLNYGYAIFRAQIRKELSIHGFEMSLGIHHESTENGFNLSDDIIETYRPFVDAFVYENIYLQDIYNLELASKKQLVQLLLEKCVIDGRVCAISDAIVITAESLISCYENKSASYLKLPAFIEVGK